MHELTQTFEELTAGFLTPEQQFMDAYKEDGIREEYYMTGEVMRRGLVENGKRQGIWETFDKNGTKLNEAPYINNMLVDGEGDPIVGYIDNTTKHTLNDTL